MEGEDILQPGVNIKPVINIDEIKKLVYDIYGFKVLKITELNGYDDKNYHIIVEKNSDEGNLIIEKSVDEGYVLKIINSLDSKKPQFFEAQSDVLVHLGKKGILCPKPVPTKEGLYFTKTKLTSGEHIVRLLQFIKGKILAKVKCTPKLLYQIGKYVAKLDQALQDFHHSAYDTHKTLWMLQYLPQLRQFIFAITDENKKQLVLEIIHEFENRVLPQLNTFKKGLIHGDVNDQNILVEEAENGELKLKTVIDFGDSQKACYLFELAVCMTYMIVHSKDIDSGGHVIAGYNAVRKVPEEEFQLLKVCVVARLCQSLVMGAYSNLQNPDAYVLRTSVNGWKLLEKMWKEPEVDLLARWKKISQNKQ